MADNEHQIICSNGKNIIFYLFMIISKKSIPESKIALHEVYCLRNVICCKNISDIVDKNVMEEYEEEKHQLVSSYHDTF